MQHESSGSELSRISLPASIEKTTPDSTLKPAETSEAAITKLMIDTKITDTASADPPREQSSDDAQVLIVDDNQINRNVGLMLSKSVSTN
jgi:hypothetical protein